MRINYIQVTGECFISQSLEFNSKDNILDGFKVKAETIFL